MTGLFCHILEVNNGGIVATILSLYVLAYRFNERFHSHKTSLHRLCDIFDNEIAAQSVSYCTNFTEIKSPTSQKGTNSNIKTINSFLLDNLLQHVYSLREFWIFHYSDI